MIPKDQLYGQSVWLVTIIIIAIYAIVIFIINFFINKLSSCKTSYWVTLFVITVVLGIISLLSYRTGPNQCTVYCTA